MKLSTRSRYGTRVLLDLALHLEQEPIPLKGIAQRQEISLPYLEHLITPLLKTGLIRSTRGSRGGISLAKSPKDIKLIDMYQILEGTTAPTECVNNPQECPRSDFCVTRDIWSEIKDAINGVLESTTLQDLVERHEQKQQTAEVMYHI